MREEDRVIFDHFLHVLPMLNDLLSIDVGVSLIDRERYLLYRPGKTLDLKVQVGSPLRPGSAVLRAITEQRRIAIKADKSIFGLPYIAVAMPIYNNLQEIIGAVSVQQSVEQQENLKTLAGNLMQSMNILAGNAEEISAQTEEIAAASQSLAQVTQGAKQRAYETDQVLGLIKTIAGQTNLLGLNASIEAARVGEHGRGFGVVAAEIRKLATTTAESIAKIEGIIKTIQSDSESSSRQVDQINQVIQQIANSVTQVSGSLQEANVSTRQLDIMAESLCQDMG